MEAPAAPSRRRRRRRRRSAPNPLFTRWLREWRDEAAGTPAAAAYERVGAALSGAVPAAAALGPRRRPPAALRAPPLPAAAAAPAPAPPRARPPLQPPPEGRGPENPLALPTRHPPRDYRPRPRSAGHALLVTLYKLKPRPQSPEPLPEAELLCQAQPLCDRLLPLAAPRTLLRRELLQQHGHPPRYSLTPQGQILAQRLAAAAPEDPPPEAPPPEAPPTEAPPPPDFELLPGHFDIILCVDIAEESGAGRRRGLVPALLRSRLPLLRRRLPVGDFLWVAREKDPPPGRPPRELALELVVERKTGADLERSLRDGRYREQKFRLGRCGLRQPLYLLEGPLPHPALRQAAASTQVRERFLLRRSGGPRESATTLRLLGEGLRRRYQGRVLRAWGGDVTGRGPPEPPGGPCALLPPERLREGGGKSQPQTVGHVFARQLLQLGGVSAPRAAAILRRFPTPASLMAALSRCPAPPQRLALLSDLRCGPQQRNLGPALSRALIQLYSTTGPLA